MLVCLWRGCVFWIGLRPANGVVHTKYTWLPSNPGRAAVDKPNIERVMMRTVKRRRLRDAAS